MLRSFLVAAAALLALSGARADDAFVRQVNFDRPGGVYIALGTPDASACAAQCARDGLCQAWSFNPNASSSCALKAVVTPARPAPGFTTGLAARAARFAALVGAELPAPGAKPARPEGVTALASAKGPQAARSGAEYGLLGGPDDAL